MRDSSTMKHAAVFLALAALGGSVALAQSSSPNYRIPQSTINSGGRTSVSGNYILTGSLGQDTAIGNSSGTNYILVGGFWGFAATGSVRPILTASTGNGGAPAAGPVAPSFSTPDEIVRALYILPSVHSGNSATRG